MPIFNDRILYLHISQCLDTVQGGSGTVNGALGGLRYHGAMELTQGGPQLSPNSHHHTPTFLNCLHSGQMDGVYVSNNLI